MLLGGLMECSQDKNELAFSYISSGTVFANKDNNLDSSAADSYRLFYVTQGKGTVTINSISYRVKKDSSFLVFPYLKFQLQSDLCDPLGYKWIEFKGTVASWLISKTAFSIRKPVMKKIPVKNIEEYFDMGHEYVDKTYSICRINGKIFVLLSYYMQYYPCNYEKNTNYVFIARDYIQKNHNKLDCTVTSVVNHVKIDRTYLYRLFKQETGMSIIQYINKCRMSHAAILLIDENISIKDVAYFVGFADQMYFSRMFKKINGQTPTEYRKSLNNHYKN